MTPDQIRRSWDDDTPRSVFPEPLAERLTRENKELRAENERLRGELAEERSARRADLLADIEETQDASDALIDALHALDYAKARHDALVADLRWLADKPSQPGRWVLPDDEDAPGEWVTDLRAILDKHAGEQP